MQDEDDQNASKQTGLSPTAQGEKGHEDALENGCDQRSSRGALLGRFWWAVLSASLLLAEMQVALDTTITADLQPAIINALGEVAKLPWINVTYSLVNGASCLLW